MKQFLFLTILLTSLTVFGQSGIGIGTESPDPSAVLDIESDDQGLLIPRMEASDRLAILSPAEGLLVFDLDSSAFYYFTGGTWIDIISSVDKYWNANGDDIYNTNSGNIGIGINDPESRLHIQDSLNSKIRFETPSQQIIVGIDETEGVFEISNDSVKILSASTDGNLYLNAPDTNGKIVTDATVEFPSFRLTGASSSTSALAVDATGMVNFISQAVMDLYSTDSVEITESWLDMQWQAQRVIDPEYLHTLSGSEITITEAGFYEVVYTIGVDIGTESHDAQSESRLSLDQGIGFNNIPGSVLKTWHNHGNAGVSASRKLILELNPGDKLKVQSRRLTTKEVYKIIEGYSFTLTKLIR